MSRARPSVTAEDLAWLEQALGQAMLPVAPRPEFVLRAKEELMRLPAARPSPPWALLAGALALLSVTIALIYLRRRNS
jgi:LPXTG-motif cell wall-anchored protein